MPVLAFTPRVPRPKDLQHYISSMPKPMQQNYTFLSDSIEETDTHILIRKDPCVLNLLDLISGDGKSSPKAFFFNLLLALARSQLQREVMKKAA